MASISAAAIHGACTSNQHRMLRLRSPVPRGEGEARMPITRCPFCGQGMVVADTVAGQLVGCSRCERTFEAQRQSSANRLGELVLVVAAVGVGAVVTWLILKSR